MKEYKKPNIQIFKLEGLALLNPASPLNNETAGGDESLGREDDMSFGWSGGSLFDGEEEE